MQGDQLEAQIRCRLEDEDVSSSSDSSSGASSSSSSSSHEDVAFVAEERHDRLESNRACQSSHTDWAHLLDYDLEHRRRLSLASHSDIKFVVVETK